MRRREFMALLGGAAAWPIAARAQQPIPLIGYLSAGSPESFAEYLAVVRRTLAEIGYVEGQNVGIEYRWSRGQADHMPALAVDLVSRNVAVIFTLSNAAAATAKAAGLRRSWPVMPSPSRSIRGGSTRPRPGGSSASERR